MSTPGRILAVGDIHGCLAAFDALWQAVDPHPHDLVIALGNYIDHGPDSAGVIGRLLRLAGTHRLVCLRGNHERMMAAARAAPDALALWHTFGADATLASYCPFGDRGSLADVPDAHWDFLDRRCVDLHETATHFFVHAGVVPHLPLDRQPPLALAWQPFDRPPPHPSGKIMVCGHTPQPNGLPRDLGHAVCLHTNLHANGWLTCLDVVSGEYWQANERGEIGKKKLEQSAN